MADYSVSPSNGAHSSQQANPRVLRGTQPGLLDPSQASRLLRYPESKLSFASFDPRTALSEEPNVQKFNKSGNPAPPKRIVIEATSRSASFWRFVPRARLEEGAQDEGVWPRVIDICGEKVQCYQEQWEIYKLDPKYLCVVYPWPRCSTVTRVEILNQGFETTDPYSVKRSRWPSPETSDPFGQKKARSRPPDEMVEFGHDSDEIEVEEMIIDESFSRKPRSGRRRDPTSRDKIRKARLDRWARNRIDNAKPVQDITVPAEGSFSMRVDSDDVFPSQGTASPFEENVKRKGDSFTESDGDSNRMSCDRSLHEHKRARTSPPQPRKGASHNHVWREKKRLERLRQYADLNRRYQRKKFAESLGFTFAPPGPVFEAEENRPKASTTKAHSEEMDNPPLEDDRSHEAEVAESIRKIRELERDRPLWEAERKKREVRERAEEEERLAKAEQRRREEEQRLKQREAAERERLAQEEAERRAREGLCQRENRQRRQKQRWESGLWTTHRALERYRMLSDEFDAARFMPGQPITFYDIPWPVLHAPSRLTVEDVDWSSVETFFATVRSHMRLQDYKEFVEKSHRRFHPDRWRARKIWLAVTNEVERGYLEVAANTVAQALTPIWRAAKER